MTVASASRLDGAWSALNAVLDPEVPALSVVDLGLVRDVIEQAREPAFLERVDALPGYRAAWSAKVQTASSIFGASCQTAVRA